MVLITAGAPQIFRQLRGPASTLIRTKITRTNWKSSPPGSPPENATPRLGEAADLHLIGISAANRWVELAHCGRGFGTPAQSEPADPFP